MLQIRAVQSLTLIADLTAALADMRISVLQINSQKCSVDETLISLVISCRNLAHLRSIITRLQSIRGVEAVIRGSG